MIAGYVGIAAVVAVAAAGAYAWDADKAFQREKRRADTAELQRDAFAKGLNQCRLDIQERNKTLSGMTGLPEVRKRLCAQREPTDGCCTRDQECKP